MDTAQSILNAAIIDPADECALSRKIGCATALIASGAAEMCVWGVQVRSHSLIKFPFYFTSPHPSCTMRAPQRASLCNVVVQAVVHFYVIVATAADSSLPIAIFEVRY